MKISYKKLWVLLMIDHSQNAREVAASTRKAPKAAQGVPRLRRDDRPPRPEPHRAGLG